MEVVGYGILAACGQIDLIGHTARNLVRNRHNQRIVCHITGVEHRSLVIEEQARHTAQVLADDTDGGLHGGRRDDGVP